MKTSQWICATLFFLTHGAVADAGNGTQQTSGGEVKEAPTYECNSCTSRHQALLRKKKEREKKEREAGEAAKNKTAD